MELNQIVWKTHIHASQITNPNDFIIDDVANFTLTLILKSSKLSILRIFNCLHAQNLHPCCPETSFQRSSLVVNGSSLGFQV